MPAFHSNTSNKCLKKNNLAYIFRPKKKVTVKLSLTFGPSGLPADPTAALQEYLRANANKLPVPLNEQIKLLSVSIAPPGNVTTS